MQVDDLYRSRKVFFRDSPDPTCSVAEHDDLHRSRLTSAYGLGINPSAKLLCRFDRSNIGGRLRIADRITLLVHLGLREDTPELGFPGFGLASRILTLASFRLPRHDRHPGPIQSQVEQGYGLEAHQLAAQSQFTLPLRATLDLPAQSFRNSFHRLRFDTNPRQFFQILASLREGVFASHVAHQATDARTKAGPHNVQLLILGDDATGTDRAVIIGPLYSNPGKHRKDFFAAGFHKPRPIALAPLGS